MFTLLFLLSSKKNNSITEKKISNVPGEIRTNRRTSEKGRSSEESKLIPFALTIPS